MLDALRRASASQEARGTTAVFLSQIVLNLSLFIVVFLASVAFNAAEFARLSLALAWVSVVANLLSFGFDQAAMKLGLERGSNGFIALNLYLKGAILIASLTLSLVAWAAAFQPSQAVVLLAASGTAFWTSTRVVEQYRREFARLAALNLALAASRMVVGGLALLTQSWAMIVVALHLLAQLPVHMFAFARLARALRGQATLRHLPPMIRTAPVMFLSSALFNAVPVVMQQTMYGRSQIEATAMFGIVLLFSAPVVLMVATLRMHLLPHVLGAGSRAEAFRPYRGKLVAPFVGMIVVFAPLSVGAFIHVIYGADHPHAGVIAVAYLSLTGVATCIGLLNMWCQRGNLIYAELIANAARFAAVGAVCYFVDDPLRMIVSSAAIYPIIELALFVFLAFHGSRRK